MPLLSRSASTLAAVAALALSLALPPALAAPYRFVTFGDWGTGSALQRSNAAAINAHCAADGGAACALILSLGDQFYNGPLNTSDHRWRTEFSELYNFSVRSGHPRLQRLDRGAAHLPQRHALALGRRELHAQRARGGHEHRRL